MTARRLDANRRNSKVSTGPISRAGKQRFARNALKHGLSVSAHPTNPQVRAFAALLAPAPESDHIAALAVEAARRIIDFNRVKDAHQQLYLRIAGSPILVQSPTQHPVERGGSAKIAASFGTEQPSRQTLAPLTIADLAKELDKLARYERRALSSRERALRELADAVAAHKSNVLSRGR
jgi:hypothetical protein